MAALDRNGNHVGPEGSDAFAPRIRDAWIDEPVCAVRAKTPGQTLGLAIFLWRETRREGGLVAQIMQPGGRRTRLRLRQDRTGQADDLQNKAKCPPGFVSLVDVIQAAESA